MIQFVMSDLDGTLVPEGSSHLPQRLVEAIDCLQRQGIPFAASSGRQHASIRRVFQVLEQEPLIVSLNGGCICRGDECLYLDPMPRETALAIAREAGEFQGCDVILETPDQCWVYRGENGVIHELEVRSYHFAQVRQLSEVTGEVVKVACFLPHRVEDFLAQAKANGEFDGKDGSAATLELSMGAALAPGAAPTVTELSGSTAQARKYQIRVPQGERGPAYELTQADMDAITASVIAKLPKYEGEVEVL